MNGKALPSDLPFLIGSVSIFGAAGAKQAMVVTPKRVMSINRERIRSVRGVTRLSSAERHLITEARNRAVNIVIFRGVNEAGERVWQFDPEIAETELPEAGRVMAEALLPMQRGLLESGVVLMVHSDMGTRECYALRDGARELVDELDRVEDPTALAQLNRWVLTNMLLHVTLGYQHVLDELLPARLGSIDRRLPSVRALFERAGRQLEPTPPEHD